MTEVNKNGTPPRVVDPGQFPAGQPIEDLSKISPENELFFRDKLAPSEQSNRPPKSAAIDAPELAFPTLQGLNKRKILEEIKKTRVLEAAKGGSLLTNPWMSNPSWMVALMNSSMKLLDMISQNRYQESQKKQETELKMTKLGIEGSNIAKDEKQAQADKEKLTAVGHIMSAVSATIQLASMPGGRDQAKKEAEQSEIGKMRADEKAKLEQMEKDTGLKGTDGTPDKKFTDLTDTEQKDLAAQGQKVHDLDMKFESAFEQALNRKTTQLELHKRIADGITNGVIEVNKSLISEYEADLAKKKGLNDVLQQSLNRVNEGTNKSKDEDLASINRINDTLKQTSEHNQRAFQLKG